MKQLPIHQNLTPRQKSILLTITHTPQIGNKDLLVKLRSKFGEIARITIIRDLNDMMRKGVITRIGKGRTARYVPQTGRMERMFKNNIPVSLKRYFWDTDPGKLSLTRHSTYIIERILEWGDPQAVRWLRGHYSKEELLRVLDKSRTISHRSWHFWKAMFVHSNKPISCTRKFSGMRQETAWKY